MTSQRSLALGHPLVRDDSQDFQRSWQDSAWAVFAQRKPAAGKESPSEVEGTKHSRPCGLPRRWPPWCGTQRVHPRWEQAGSFSIPPLAQETNGGNSRQGGGGERGDRRVWSHTAIKRKPFLKSSGSGDLPSGRLGGQRGAAWRTGLGLSQGCPKGRSARRPRGE